MASRVAFPLPPPDRVILIAAWLVGLVGPAVWYQAVSHAADARGIGIGQLFDASIGLRGAIALAVILYAVSAFATAWYVRRARGTWFELTGDGFEWRVEGAPITGWGAEYVREPWSAVSRLKLKRRRTMRQQTALLVLDVGAREIELDLVAARPGGEGYRFTDHRERLLGHPLVKGVCEATGLEVASGS
jgi:hypothetical protein